MYLPVLPGHQTGAAHPFQPPHLIHTPYTTAPGTRGSPHPPLSPHISHPSPHGPSERPHQQPSPFQREAKSPAEYAAATAAAQQAAAQQAAAQQAAAQQAVAQQAAQQAVAAQQAAAARLQQQWPPGMYDKM